MTLKFPPNVIGIGLMIISVGILAGIDSIVKYAANEGMHPIQIVFFRNLFGLVALLPLFFRSNIRDLRTDRIGFHFVRGCIHSAGMTSWFIALTLIPLADATAVSFTIPIYASIGAILFMGEPSRRHRWIAIGLGLVGMLMMLRPGLSEVSPGALLVVGSAVFAATSKLMMKSLSRTDGPVTIVFFMSLTITVVSFIPSIFFWKWPPMMIWFWLMLLGTGGSLAHVLQTYSYKMGEVTAVEPVSYFRLIWAAIFGLILFQEFPHFWTWAGTAIIITGALLLTRDEVKKSEKNNIASVDYF